MGLATVTVDSGVRNIAIADPAGAFRVPSADNEPERPTYRAFVFNLQPSGNVTDLIVLGGAAGKNIRLKSLIISGTATSATNIGLYVFKRTTAASGGTTTNITKTAADTQDPASAASLVHYAAGVAPTVGTGTMLDGCRLNLAPAANGSIDRALISYSWQNDKAPCARGVLESLTLGMNNVALPAGGALDVSITWSEEG